MSETPEPSQQHRPHRPHRPPQPDAPIVPTDPIAPPPSIEEIAPPRPMVEEPLTVGERVGLYGKAFAGAVVAGMSAYLSAVDDGVSTADWITIVLAFLASFGIIWAIPNTPRFVASLGKALFAGLAAAGASLIPSFSDGALSTPEIVAAIVAFLIGTGLTGTVSNAASSDPVDARGKMVAVPAEVKDAMLGGAHVRRLGPHVVLDPGRAA